MLKSSWEENLFPSVQTERDHRGRLGRKERKRPVKREADFVTVFGRFIRSREGQKVLSEGGMSLGAACAFEFKVAQGSRLPLSHVPPHQVEALMRAKHGGMVGGMFDGGLWHKISDSAEGFKPCDALYIRSGRGLMVIWYQGTYNALKRSIRKRGALGKEVEGEVVIVDVDLFQFVKQKKEGRGSITREEWNAWVEKEICVVIPYQVIKNTH